MAQYFDAHDPALAEVEAAGSPDDIVGVLGQLAFPDRLPTDVRVITRFGDVVTMHLRRRDLQKLAASDACEFIEFGRPLLNPENDALGAGLTTGSANTDIKDVSIERTLASVTTEPTEQTRPLDLGATGRGCVVGVIDWGIDFAHPAFRDAQGRTRLIAIWDQRRNVVEAQENRWGYGRIITRDEINAALATDDPYQTLDYLPADSDRSGRGAHGTHVASIAAGSDYTGGRPGVASGADIVFVHLGNTPNILSTKTLGSAQSAIEGADFIFEQAGERPAVINLSVGAHGGSHTGDSLVERGMDQAVWAKPNRAIVNSAGNYRQKSAHASGRLSAGQHRLLSFTLPPDDANSSEIEVFYPAVDSIAVSLLAPGGHVFGPLMPGGSLELNLEDQKIGQVYHRLHRPSGDKHIDIFLYPSAPDGDWQLRLDALEVLDGRFHAWVERDASQQPRFSSDDVDTLTTIGTLANGKFTITTGAYDARSRDRRLGEFSSVGPTRRGLVKPEVIAPGVNIVAARSAPRGASPGPRSTSKSGTSMAAPAVAGTVALMFEVAGKPLEITDTRALLFESLDPARACGRRACFKEDLHGSGFGYLDVENAIRTTRQWRERMDETSLPADAITDSNDLEDCAPVTRSRPEQRRYASGAQRGDVLIIRSPGEGIQREAVLLTNPGINLQAAAAAGLHIESAGAGLYAEVLEPNSAGNGFVRAVRKVVSANGRPVRGRRVYPIADTEESTPSESLPNLSAWQDLISFRPPLSVQRSLVRSYAPDWSVHRIEDARGDINLDFYPVRVNRLPIVSGRRLTAEQLLGTLRLNIDRFIDTRYASFRPYNAAANRRWRSSSPLGSVIHIDMRTAGGYVNPDDGSVVCSRFAPDHWVFSTIWTPADFGHPVSGNRQFGFLRQDGEYIFYTRGADRTTGRLDSAMSGTVFGKADALWRSLQRGLANFVNSNGGTAVWTSRVSRRHNWSAVKRRYWRPSVRWI